MRRWQSYFMLTYVTGVAFGATVGGLLAAILGLSGAWFIVVALSGAFVLVIFFGIRDIVFACRIMAWLVDEQHADFYVSIPERSKFWAEFSRRIGRIVKDKDEKIDFEHARLQQFLEALQATPTGVVLLDKRNCLIWANAAAATFFELDLPRDYLQQITNLVRQPEFFDFLEKGQDQHGMRELRMGWGQSHEGLVEIQLVPYGVQSDKLLLIQDVTRQEHSEQMRRDFVANVSHEIRTPLTVLSGFVETMQNLPLSDEQREHYLGLMAQQSERMHYLINDLLTLARLEGTPPPDLDIWFDVQAVLFQTQQAVKQFSPGKHILIFPNTQEIPYQIAGSEVEISGALLNLVSNAIRYTPCGSQIKVSWQMGGNGSGALVVDDNGPGIEQEHLSRLSERFYRVDKSRSRQTGGTGLGLSIVKHTMQRHGGSLEIQSELGKGASFRLSFPAHHVRKKCNEVTDAGL